jgi:large subunit ribosomal protein L6
LYGELNESYRKKTNTIPAGVKIEHSGTSFKATGPKGTLQMNIHPDITVSVENNQVVVSNDDDNNRQKKALHGTTRR